MIFAFTLVSAARTTSIELRSFGPTEKWKSGPIWLRIASTLSKSLNKSSLARERIGSRAGFPSRAGRDPTRMSPKGLHRILFFVRTRKKARLSEAIAFTMAVFTVGIILWGGMSRIQGRRVTIFLTRV